MKKVVFILLMVLPVFMIGCSDDEQLSPYSEKQEKAFALFNGTWADI